MGSLADTPTEDFYPIRTVASLTGVSAITLRAWERRYNLIEPRRTESGHRLYSLKNIEVINRARELQDQGISISQVAVLLKQRLATEVNAPRVTEETWLRYQQDMLEAIRWFSEARLDVIYEEVLATHSIQKVIRKLIIPILEQIGDLWITADTGVAEEHFFAVYMRNKLGALFHHRTRLVRGEKILAACMPGELHEVGLLLFALSAHDAGYRPVLLGANMPLQGLSLTAHRAGCAAIVLSARRAPPAQIMNVDLPALVRTSQFPVFVGGAASVTLNDEFVRAGAISLGQDIDTGLRRLSEKMSLRQPASDET